jgi:hypothetical protein
MAQVLSKLGHLFSIRVIPRLAIVYCFTLDMLVRICDYYSYRIKLPRRLLTANYVNLLWRLAPMSPG